MEANALIADAGEDGLAFPCHEVKPGTHEPVIGNTHIFVSISLPISHSITFSIKYKKSKTAQCKMTRT